MPDLRPDALEIDPKTSRIVEAEPYPLSFDLSTTALIIIDMQRDFLEPGGFGELLGNDVSLLRSTIEPTRDVLDAARSAGLTVIHTREGHRPDLMDAPPSKLARGNLDLGIGDDGPMGRILVRGEEGHNIIPELSPLANEPVVDKPGKGAFFRQICTFYSRIITLRLLLYVVLLPKCAFTPLCVRPTTEAMNV